MQGTMLAAHQQGEDKLLGGVGDEDGDGVDDNEDRLNEDPNLRHRTHIKEPPTLVRVDGSSETSSALVLQLLNVFYSSYQQHPCHPRQALPHVPEAHERVLVLQQWQEITSATSSSLELSSACNIG